jgi:hypothetical protein
MHLIQLISEAQIPGWNCTFQEEGSGGGVWICHPPDDEIRPLAEKLYKHWAEEATWSPGASDPGPWHFWFEAEAFVIEKYKEHHP